METVRGERKERSNCHDNNKERKWKEREGRKYLEKKIIHGRTLLQQPDRDLFCTPVRSTCHPSECFGDAAHRCMRALIRFVLARSSFSPSLSLAREGYVTILGTTAINAVSSKTFCFSRTCLLAGLRLTHLEEGLVFSLQGTERSHRVFSLQP